MRTKTLALSTVLGALGGASSLVAQTNVYSLNAVGYINVTMPPGYSIVTCPLICSPDNTLNTLFPNGNGVNTPPSGIPYAFCQVLQFSGGSFTAIDSGNGVYSYGGWANGGADVTLNPGQAVFFQNPNSTNVTATFVGTVPQGSLTNALIPGYNLVGSMVPIAGDLSTNTYLNLNNVTNQYSAAGALSGSVSPGYGDYILFFNGATQSFASSIPTEGGQYSPGWSGGAGVTGGPVTTNVAEGFYYYNSSVGAPPNFTAVTENWVENFTINP
jgi:hypothetical protein